jgi:copper chaperone CopZ
MVVEVDLDCERCNKKITRVLENIKGTVLYNPVSCRYCCVLMTTTVD